ncbi:MAG: FHA domain-containing protein [Clostridia bacterium]|nr:FHA domain-containing protein [Clostridia bacterium]
MMDELYSFLVFSHYLLPVFAVIIVLLCLVALLRRRMPSLGRARIIIESSGKSFPIKYRETSIGRSKACDIVLKPDDVSRQHAVIVCAKEGWYIAESSGSPLTVNGLKVNKRADIASGDRIGVGSVMLRFDNPKQRTRQ